MKETASGLPLHGVISRDLLVLGQLLVFCKTTSKSKAAENRTAMKDNLKTPKTIVSHFLLVRLRAEGYQSSVEKQAALPSYRIREVGN